MDEEFGVNEEGFWDVYWGKAVLGFGVMSTGFIDYIEKEDFGFIIDNKNMKISKDSWFVMKVNDLFFICS